MHRYRVGVHSRVWRGAGRRGRLAPGSRPSSARPGLDSQAPPDAQLQPARAMLRAKGLRSGQAGQRAAHRNHSTLRGSCWGRCCSTGAPRRPAQSAAAVGHCLLWWGVIPHKLWAHLPARSAHGQAAAGADCQAAAALPAAPARRHPAARAEGQSPNALLPRPPPEEPRYACSGAAATVNCAGRGLEARVARQWSIGRRTAG